MSTTNQQLLTLFEEYRENSDKFAEKGNKRLAQELEKPCQKSLNLLS